LSGLPIYYQIKQTIKRWIVNKEYSSGDRIPSEKELADRFNVSRLTVRQAISQLSQEGFLISKRGEGTFVTDDQNLINHYSLEFSGFMDDLFYQISKVKTKSVVMQKVLPPKLVRARLNLDKNQEIVNIKRVRLLRDNVFAYTVNYLPLEIGTRISETDLYKKPLLQIIEQDLGIPFTQAFQTIEASFADEEVAEKLEVPMGSPILFLERTMFSTGNKPVEFVQSSHRGDMYKYVLRLKGSRKGSQTRWTTYIKP
jgi:GntR family transcriptional regulator